MLEIQDLHVYYGGIHALHGISLQVPEGQIVTLLGANGAGKSSTLRVVAGIVKPASGQVRLDGRSITTVDGHLAPGVRPLVRRLARLEDRMLLRGE